MHAERLHATVQEVVQEFIAQEIPAKIAEVLRTYKALLDPPADSRDPTDRVDFETARRDLFTVLANVPSNDFSPSQIRLLEEISAWSWTGIRLRDRIRTVLEEGPVHDIDQMRAQAEEFGSEFSTKWESLRELVSAFRNLGVDQQFPPAGAAEFGALYPMKVDKVSLRELYEELKRLRQIMRVFPELAGESPEEFRVRSISNEGISLSLLLTINAAWAALKAIEAVSNIIVNATQIRARLKELSELGWEEGDEEQIQKYVDERVDEATHDILEEYEGDDEPRTRELETYLRMALEYMLDRVSRGAVFEVRVLPTGGGDEKDDSMPGFEGLKDMQRRGRSMAELPSREFVLEYKVPEQIAPPEDGGEATGDAAEGSDPESAEG